MDSGDNQISFRAYEIFFSVKPCRGDVLLFYFILHPASLLFNKKIRLKQSRKRMDGRDFSVFTQQEELQTNSNCSD